MQTVLDAAPAATRPHHDTPRASRGPPPRFGSKRLGRFARRPARGAAPALSGLRRRRRRPSFSAAGHAARPRRRPLRRVLRPPAWCGRRRRRGQRRGRRHLSGADSRRRAPRRRLLQRDRVRSRAARAAALAHGRARPLLHPSRLAHRRHDPRALERSRRVHGAARPRRRLRLRQRRHARRRPRRRQPLAPAVAGASRAGRAAGPAAAAAARSRPCATISTSRRRR